MKYLVLLSLTIVAAACASDATAFTLSTDFPGGSAEVRSLDVEAGRIVISPEVQEGRGWPCWWYFRVDGAQPGQKLTLTVTASDRPFRVDRRLAASWALPERAAISTDDTVWKQTPPGEITKQSGTYQIVAPASRFWLAWGPPFLPSHAEALLESAAAKVPGAERFVLAKTRESRPVHAIRFGSPKAPNAIWIQARQHAWESGGSWVGRGFLEWVTSDAEEAVQLRQSTEIFFVPIMDVDNVTRGAGGKDAVPRDHNRDWAAAPHYPEVAAAQRRIGQLAEEGRLRVFIDLHNPSPSDKQPYYYGPLDYNDMTGQRRQNYDRFLDLSIQNITDPLPIYPKYRFATYVKTEEERQRVSGNWTRAHGGRDVVAMTLETAWNTPHSTTDGYLQVGQGLAQTIAGYLAER